MARGDDGPHSDLELVAILEEGPRGRAGVLHEGMLIELEWMTETEWLASCRGVTKAWHAAGGSRLEPVAGCRKQAAAKWSEVQDSTSRVLTTIERGNRESLRLLAWMMVLDLLGVVALLNETPYTTLATFVPEARGLPHQPQRFDELLDVFAEGRYGQDPEHLRALIADVIGRFEAHCDERDIPLGEGDLDALRPGRD